MKMAVEAPYSKYRKTNLKIYTGFCIVFAVVFGYDGYMSKYDWSLRRSFYEEHVKDGRPDDTMLFNRMAPVVLFAGALLPAFRLRAVRNKKLSAGENELVLGDGKKLTYDSIEKIDKTAFDKKGVFIITYRNKDGTGTDLKVSEKDYDNLGPLLDEVVAKIS